MRVTFLRVAVRSSVIPSSSSFVSEIWLASTACELLSRAISAFWSAILRARSFCCCWARESSSAWTVPGAATGAPITPMSEGDREEGDEEAAATVSAGPRESLRDAGAGQRRGVLNSSERGTVFARLLARLATER